MSGNDWINLATFVGGYIVGTALVIWWMKRRWRSHDDRR
jgi:hypothetical protein